MEHSRNTAQTHDLPERSMENGIKLLSRYRGALMGFAALLIYLFHIWQPVFGSYPGKIPKIENFVTTIGFFGVDIFLFLSGIGITYSLEKSKNVLFFYYKKIKRIIIPFVLVGILNCWSEGWTSAQFWKNILCVSFYKTSIYSCLWFVPAILTLYFFAPLYYRLFTRASGKVRFTFCALVIWLLCTLYVRDTLRYDMFGFTNRIPIFLIGILAGWFIQNSDMVFDGLAWVGMALTFLLGIYLAYLTNYADMYILVPTSNCCLPNIFLAVSTSFLFVGILSFLCGKRYCRPLGKGLVGIFSFFGKFTLEFYCVQEWLLARLLPRISQYGNVVANMILFVVITTAALLLYYLSRYFWFFAEWAVQKMCAAYREGLHGSGRAVIRGKDNAMDRKRPQESHLS
ncbi:MAG: acyltransferase [Eubacterium sp.]|nr:acyltransferase [Eubacterium sp.]